MNTHRFRALCAGVLIPLISTVAHAIPMPIPGQGTWEITLQGRDLDGNPATFEAYYDTVLDITWLADAEASPDFLTWEAGNAWAANLDVNGVTGWRLPTVTPVNGSTFNNVFSNNGSTDFGFADAAGLVDSSGTPVSEFGHLNYVTLGNLGRCTPDNSNPSGCATQAGSGLSNTGPFSNVSLDLYWTSTEFNSVNAWYFSLDGGFQNNNEKHKAKFLWPVRSGDVSIVPIPAAGWLLGSGLMVLLSAARRRR